MNKHCKKYLGSEAEQRRDGDYLTHDERHERTDKYLGILRRLWTEDRPFDHEGKFYRSEGGFSEVKPLQQPYVPIFFGGASQIATEVAAYHADIYALWGEPLDQLRKRLSLFQGLVKMGEGHPEGHHRP